MFQTDKLDGCLVVVSLGWCGVVYCGVVWCGVVAPVVLLGENVANHIQEVAPIVNPGMIHQMKYVSTLNRSISVVLPWISTIFNSV